MHEEDHLPRPNSAAPIAHGSPNSSFNLQRSQQQQPQTSSSSTAGRSTPPAVAEKITPETPTPVAVSSASPNSRTPLIAVREPTETFEVHGSATRRTGSSTVVDPEDTLKPSESGSHQAAAAAEATTNNETPPPLTSMASNGALTKEESLFNNTWSRLGVAGVQEVDDGQSSPHSTGLAGTGTFSGTLGSGLSQTTPSPSSGGGALLKERSASTLTKRKKSTINMHLAKEEARQQLQLEGIQETQDEEVERQLSAHKSNLQSQGGKKKAADIAREREESELHKMVDRMMKENEELRRKLKDQSQARLGAEEKLKAAELKLHELEDTVEELQHQGTSLQAQLEAASTEVVGLREEAERNQTRISIAPTVKKKGATKVVTATALNLVQKYESKFRSAVEVYEQDLRTMLHEFCHRIDKSSTLKLSHEAAILRGDRSMQDQHIENLQQKIRALEYENTEGEKKLQDAKKQQIWSRDQLESELKKQLADTTRELLQERQKVADAVERAERADRAASAATAMAAAASANRSAAAGAVTDDSSSSVKSSPPRHAAFGTLSSGYQATSSLTTGTRRSVSPGNNSRSISQSTRDGPHPWYPPGSGTDFHKTTPRTKSPKLGTHRDYGSKSPSASPPRPSPRREIPQATPRRGSTASSAQGRTPVSSGVPPTTRTPPPGSSPASSRYYASPAGAGGGSSMNQSEPRAASRSANAGSSRRRGGVHAPVSGSDTDRSISPPKESYSRTMGHLHALVAELSSWENQVQ